jgi:hypothetical protein
MYASCAFFRLVVAVWLIAIAAAGDAGAQAPAHEGHAAAQDPHAGHAPPQEQHAGHEAATGSFSTRDASGTAWLPDTTPMYGLHRTVRGWEVMFHGAAFAQFLHEGGEEHRRSNQAGSINWFMGMARRPLGAGRIGVRGMISLEPWTIPGCGYPDLLATGETCDGDTIHDRQHPHDLFMELAVEYDRPLTASMRLQLYGGPVGEPALGPVAFPHRLSAMPNPIAPIGHHWLDATHITFGVLTGAVYTRQWKAEASVFNGREPDEVRHDLDLDRLDSYAGRLWWLPTTRVAVQLSAGHLNEAESGHDRSERVDVDRVTASATYHRPFDGGASIWASTIAWGRNLETGEASHFLLAETNITRHDRDSWFARVDAGGKAAHDLDLHESDARFTVAKMQAGYVRYAAVASSIKAGVGGFISLSVVPSGLESVYGSRATAGFGVFLTFRPSAMAPTDGDATHTTH